MNCIGFSTENDRTKISGRSYLVEIDILAEYTMTDKR
jgi:hypothetical protein